MMVRLLDAGARRFRPAIGWAAFVLLFLAVWTSVLGLIEADWVDGDERLFYVASVGALLCALLAHTRVRGYWAALISMGSGLLYVSQSLARFVPPPVRALVELDRGLDWLWLRIWEPRLAPPAMPLWNESAARLLTFGERLASWASTLAGGQSEQNPVAFLFVSGLLVWGGASWAVWLAIRRGRALLALLPLGLMLSMSAYLSGGAIGYVIGFAGCVLLLLPILDLAWQERRWERAGIDYSTEIRFDVWQVAVLVVIAALLLSVITPSVSIPRLLQAFWEVADRPQQAIEQLLFRFLGNIQPVPQPEMPVPGETGTALPPASAALPRSHLLGGDTGSSNVVVMTVCTDGPAPPPEELLLDELVDPGPRHYWKGITYDLYTGQQWVNGANSTSVIPAYEPVLQSTVTPTNPLRQRFVIQAPHGYTLYAAAEAASVDQQVESRRRTVGDLVGLEGRTDDYVVYSDIPQASARQLVAASPIANAATYSPFVVNRYLGLPAKLPERVEALAQEIVAGVDSTYDRALAIERYLRQFPYDLGVPTPPAGRDVVDYFLFDAQRGYCDYYASAFVVLARAVGIPSRLAIGYTMGAYSYQQGCYVVAERNAHSWPEVYFGDLGWIAFEPTAAYEPLSRPLDPIQPAFPSTAVQPPPERPWDVAVREWWRRVRPEGGRELLVGGAVVSSTSLMFVLLVIFAVRGVRALRRRNLPPVQGIALCYAEMEVLGAQLGAPREPQDTPAEYARTLAAAIEARVARWPWTPQTVMPLQTEAAHDTARLSQAYQRASYHPQSVTRQQRSRTDQMWKRLQRQLRRLAFTSRT